MPFHNFARPEGRLVELEIDSQALKNNMLGDPTKRTVVAYLPAGYDSSDTDYPLFVDLVGFTGSGLSHLSWKAFWESVPVRLDRLVREGKMGEVIAVFPDCFTSLGGNQYINSISTGNWEDFLIDEMIPAIEGRFRVRKGRENRAVFGKSSGGYGSIVHGLKRADAWGAVACHSGDMDFELVYRSEFPTALDQIAKHGGLAELLEHLKAARELGSKEFHTLMTLAMAATYDPDPDGPMGVRLPVDLTTCQIIEERWDAWRVHDPLVLVDQAACQENLKKLSGVFIDCGNVDQYHLHYGARSFVAKLNESGVPHHYEEFDDDHSGVDYRMDVSLPFLYEAVTRTR